MTVLEDLIVENARNYPRELREVRAVMPDGQATADLKADSKRMARLAELAGVNVAQTAPGQPDHEVIADVAVRGPYVSFVVLDAQGVPSNGAFSLAELDGSSDSDGDPLTGGRAAVVGQTGRPGVVAGGTASVPTVARDGGVQQPLGVPGNIDELSPSEVRELLKNPPQGVDPRAVAAYEQAKDEPRPGVLGLATGLGLFEPNTSAFGGPDPQAQQSVQGEGTTPEGGNSLPGPDEGGGDGGDGGDEGDTGGGETDAISQLRGSALTDAVTEAGIDWKTGGSRADGSLTADEARAALRARTGAS